MTVKAMLLDLPMYCDIGIKKNSKGYKVSWQGYKLHIDYTDTGIPVSCALTAASVHDSPIIKKHSQSLGHVPIIDVNPRKKGQKAALELELKAKRVANYKTPEAIRYNLRGSVERVNGRLKDEFGGRMVRVKGHAKVMSHLMFGIIALSVDQLMKYIE